MPPRVLARLPRLSTPDVQRPSWTSCGFCALLCAIRSQPAPPGGLALLLGEPALLDVVDRAVFLQVGDRLIDLQHRFSRKRGRKYQALRLAMNVPDGHLQRSSGIEL